MIKTSQAILVTILCVQSLFGQKLKFEHITTQEGLSNGNVRSLYQDKDGFFWIGTEDGMNKYDGYSFQYFKNDLQNTNTISNNIVKFIDEDQDGMLWIATREGLNRYDKIKHIFTRYVPNPKDSTSLPNSNIFKVLVDSRNNVWVCTNGGLGLYDRVNDRFINFHHKGNDPNSLVSDLVRSITEDKQGNFWIATLNGLSKLNIQDTTFTNFKHDPKNKKSINSNQIMSIFADRQDNIMIGTTDRGLDIYNQEDGIFQHFLPDPIDPVKLIGPYIYNISQDHHGAIWISDDGGLCRFDRATGNFTRYLENLNDDFSISSNIITDVLFDANNTMWVATLYGGINHYDSTKYVFNHIKHIYNDPSTPSGNNIQGMCEDKDGNIWMGIDGWGLNKFNPETNTYTYYRHDPYDENSIASDKVLNVITDEFGFVWIGMWNAGVTRFDPKSNTYKRYRNDPDDASSLSDDNIFDFYIDKDGDLWIATWSNGINKYNYDSDNFTRYTHDPYDPSSMGKTPVITMIQDYTGMFWLGTQEDGIYLFDKEKGTFTSIKSGFEEGALSSNGIYSIFEDSKKRIWIGTGGGGLNLYERESGTFRFFSKSDGLPNNAIFGILEDDQGNIWVSTNGGISRFHPDSLVFRNFNTSDGIQANQFNRWANLKTSTGKLIFGGPNGFNMFDPNEIRTNTVSPSVYITGIRLFNKPVEVGEGSILEQDISVTDEIVLSHEQNFISFDFTALNYGHTDKIQYRYMLEGQDDSWVDMGNERRVTFTYLNPGKYQLHVIASSSADVWDGEGATLDIIIRPPWWKTTWARILLGLSLVGLIYFLYLARIRVLEAREEELKELVDEQTKMLSMANSQLRAKNVELETYDHMVSHDLKAPISQVGVLADLISDDPDSKLSENGKEYVRRISNASQSSISLIEGILEFASADKPYEFESQVDLKRQVEKVVDSLSVKINEVGAKVHIDELPVLERAVSVKVYQLFYNLIANALKFHREGVNPVVRVYSKNEEGVLFIVVEDNGVGFEQKDAEEILKPLKRLWHRHQYEGFGIGLSTCKRIADFHNWGLRAEGSKNEGAKFIIEIRN